jgi:hypothetical protein
LKDVLVRYFLVPASAPTDVIAKEVSEGIYEAPVVLDQTGAYYIYVSVPSMKLGYNDSGFFSVMARPDPNAPAEPAAPAQPAKEKKAPKKG